ncbi:capsular biosynthesis protein [Alphaproteobacteria bacterium]|nr:capsular biosynthesis protein [Alphaproteobacteria bacterium]
MSTNDKPKIVIDLDGTLTIDNPEKCYSEKEPNLAVIEKLREYESMGYDIEVFTARNMQTFGGDLQKITSITLPDILGWLDKHDVPYSQVLVGKPWCGTNGFYVDDKAIRPDEFISKSTAEILKVIN